MEFNTKQELYEYLDAFDFDSIKDTKLSSVYFLIEFDNHIEPIHFTHFEDVWFESPCDLHKCPLEDDKVKEYVDYLYAGEFFEYAYEYEKTMQRNGWHYEIDCPQCFPFLPDRIIIQDVFSDSKCLDWLLDQAQEKKMEEIYNKLVEDRKNVKLVQTKDSFLYHREPFSSFLGDCCYCSYYVDGDEMIEDGWCKLCGVDCGGGFTCKDNDSKWAIKIEF